MPNSKNQIEQPLVLVGRQNGLTIIPQPTPLTRLNYFDGKFLRADDLSTEQSYLRRLVEISNQSGGEGVVNGYNLSLSKDGDTLELSSGLAIDAQGRVLLLPVAQSINVQQLIDKSFQLNKEPSTTTSVDKSSFTRTGVEAETPAEDIVAQEVSTLYLITIAFAEALYGQEDVYGKICEQACVTSTDRPYLIEGIIVRAIPLQRSLLPASKITLSQLHLRSITASAYFENERQKITTTSFIPSNVNGLANDRWCFGAEAEGGAEVPIGVIARAGNQTLFLDPWIARRERIDKPPKRYWQYRMAMRPWNVFIAQILQFQCQLSELLKNNIPLTVFIEDDPTSKLEALLEKACLELKEIDSSQVPERVKECLTVINQVKDEIEANKVSSEGLLINGGIIELPSAGYLSINPDYSVKEQVRLLVGEGVDLRFCVVRSDFVPHALENAQHMERISLLKGLDNPKEKPKVDILVPDGEIEKGKSDPKATCDWVFFHRRREKACTDIYEPVRDARIVLKVSSGEGYTFVTDESSDIKFDTTDQIVDGKFSENAKKWLSEHTGTQNYTIYLINDPSKETGFPQKRIEAVKHALIGVKQSLNLEINWSVVAPNEIENCFGNDATEILKHLKDPSLVQDLFLLYFSKRTISIEQESCWEKICGCWRKKHTVSKL